MNHQKKKFRSVTLAVLIYSFLSLVALRSGQAQDCHGGPPPEKRGAGPYGPPPGGPPPGNQDSLHRPPPGPAGETRSTLRGGLQLGPPGRWWDDPPFARELGLNAVQANRMDEIFQANRSTLLGLYRSLQREQATLERLTNRGSFARAGDLSPDRSGHASQCRVGEGKRPHVIADSRADDRRTNRKVGSAPSKTAELKTALRVSEASPSLLTYVTAR